MLINEHQNETNRQTDSDTVFGELGERKRRMSIKTKEEESFDEEKHLNRVQITEKNLK